MPPPLRRIGNASLDNVPDFEKPAARSLEMAAGSEPDSIAHATGSGAIPRMMGIANKIYVDDPSAMSQPILAHEVMHKIQQQAGNFRPNEQTYDYGGINGLSKLKSIASLNPEQQANIPQDYQAQMQQWGKGPITQKILGQADQLNAAYARPIQQLSNMAADQINTTPQAPGPPPAALTGMIKPLPQMGGPSMNMPLKRIGQ